MNAPCRFHKRHAGRQQEGFFSHEGVSACQKAWRGVTLRVQSPAPTSLTPHSQAALILAGHGSTVNPDSSAPTHSHADRIRRMGVFREVVCCFWKEEPSMREVYEMLESEVVYVVPNFISEGYFCQEVLPRELRVTGPECRVGDKLVRYCDPVGIHPNMTRLLLQRADEVAPGVPRSETSLVIVGHGTNLNDNSTKAIKSQVDLIKNGGHGFAEVLDAYMEEAPLVAEWDKMTTAPNVVVVPFFIADGLHSYQDIPVLLGIAEDEGKAASQSDVFRHNPHVLRGRSLYFSGAIGTEPLMADVILDQVAEYEARHGVKTADGCLRSAHAEWVATQVGTTGLLVGQVQVTSEGGGYELRHAADAGADGLRSFEGAAAAREQAWLDEKGGFRPLKSAPNLQRGWRVRVEDAAELKLALDFLYPAAVGMAFAEAHGRLQSTPLRELLGRQTGMYRFANKITDEQACEIVGRVCDTASKCARRIVWPLAAGLPLSGPAEAKAKPTAGPVPLLCMEACPHVVSEARKVARQNHEASLPKVSV